MRRGHAAVVTAMRGTEGWGMPRGRRAPRRSCLPAIPRAASGERFTPPAVQYKERRHPLPPGGRTVTHRVITACSREAAPDAPPPVWRRRSATACRDPIRAHCRRPTPGARGGASPAVALTPSLRPRSAWRGSVPAGPSDPRSHPAISYGLRHCAACRDARGGAREASCPGTDEGTPRRRLGGHRARPAGHAHCCVTP